MRACERIKAGGRHFTLGTNVQLYLAIGIPVLLNASLLGLVVALMNAKFDGINAKFDAKFEALNTKFEAINDRFDAIDRRFDDMRDLWRAELRRVEAVLDARLKHIEGRR
jgi:hypothetical protein